MSRPLRWDNGLSLSPFGELHVRPDGGAGQTGTGMAVVDGTRLVSGRVRVHAQGRLLVLHSAEGYRERGVGVTLGVGNRDPTGLSLSLSSPLGRRRLRRRNAGAGLLALLAGGGRRRVGVGRAGRVRDAAPSGGPLTWFGSLSLSAYGKRFLVGSRVGELDGMLSPGYGLVARSGRLPQEIPPRGPRERPCQPSCTGQLRQERPARQV